MLNRRECLVVATSGLSSSLAGCLQGEAGSGERDEKYTHEVICQEPPEGVSVVDYDQPPPGAPQPEFLDGGYWSGSEEKTEENRLGIITEGIHEDLDFSTSSDDEEDPVFFEETDFETSVLLTFEYIWYEQQEFTIQAVTRDAGGVVHVYACRFGDPNPRIDGEDIAADRAAAHGTAVIRVKEAVTRAKLTYTWLPLSEDTPERETFTTGPS